MNYFLGTIDNVMGSWFSNFISREEYLKVIRRCERLGYPSILISGAVNGKDYDQHRFTLSEAKELGEGLPTPIRFYLAWVNDNQDDARIDLRNGFIKLPATIEMFHTLKEREDRINQLREQYSNPNDCLRIERIKHNEIVP